MTNRLSIGRLNKNIIVQVEGRNTKVNKFGNNGGNCGIFPQRHGRTVARGDDGDSDADDWQEREGAKKVRNLIKKVAQSFPSTSIPLTQPVPESPGGWSRVGDNDAVPDHSLWVNWKQEFVPAHQISWRDEITNAQPDEGSIVEVVKQEGHLWSYLATFTRKLPRDMTREEIVENWKEVFAPKVKEIAGLYEFGCFKRWPRHRSDNHSDAGWAIIWKMIEGNVGAKCRLAVGCFKDKFQDSDIYAGSTSRSGQRLANAVAAAKAGVLVVLC